MDQLPLDSEILALVPEYTDCGNAVRLFLTGGREMLIGGTLRAVLRALARRRCKDLGLLRAYAARYTQRRFANPLAVSPDLVLAPLRTREPKIPGDPTQGLVNVAAPIRLADAGNAEDAPAKSRAPARRRPAAAKPSATAPAGKPSAAAPSGKPSGAIPTGKSFGDAPAGNALAVEPSPAIELPGGRRIPLGWSAATVRRHLADARSLHADLVREQQESLLRRLAAGTAASLP